MAFWVFGSNVKRRSQSQDLRPPWKAATGVGMVERRTVMSTPAPATMAQGQKILALMSQSGASREEIQNFLEGIGDLVVPLLRADYSSIDRAAFHALLAPPLKSIDWTPVSQYAEKIRDWNRRFGLGLSDTQLTAHELLLLDEGDHAGPLLPTSISLTLGKSLQHDWEVVMEILKYEVEKLGVPFKEYFDASCLSYSPGSEPSESKVPQLVPALLDIGRFWDTDNGVVPRKVREQLKGRPLPGLEVAWLLALNPQVFLAMDGKTIPFLCAAGLVVYSDDLLCFDRGSGGAFVSDRWDGDRWYGCSVVAFRE
jgi:hypothetical protein